MQLSELFANLSEGELSNLAISDEGSGEILANAQSKIVGYTNDGLLKLYSRFVLKERELVLQLKDTVLNYRLLPKYAATYIPTGIEVSETFRYIRDTSQNPFTGDLIKIIAVFDNRHQDVPLNDDNLPNSVFTPQANLLQVPCICPGRMLSVLYQAKHPKLTGDLNQVVELPDVFFNALRAYIAYKAFSHMNTADSTAKAQEYLGVFESECQDAVDKDLVSTSISSSNSRFKQRGWI